MAQSSYPCPKCEGTGPCDLCYGDGVVTMIEMNEYLDGLNDNDAIRDTD